MDKNDELVLVVPTDDLFNKPFTGVIPVVESHAKLAKALSHLDIKRRGDVEEDPSYKQLISYVVVKNNKEKRFFTPDCQVEENPDFMASHLSVSVDI